MGFLTRPLKTHARTTRTISSQATARKRFRKQLRIEQLEDRRLMAGDVAISISDASAVEGDTRLKLLDRFVQTASGGLNLARASAFGADGNGDGKADLYVISALSNEILRYDGESGAFLDAFVTAGSGGLVNPSDFEFGPDGSCTFQVWDLCRESRV